ncbi:MAG TPA: hypothetical protein VF070_18005 [Streptosporangiaceae bacterium]
MTGASSGIGQATAAAPGDTQVRELALANLLVEHITGRVVTVASQAERFARLDFDDLNWELRPYQPSRAYQDSELANLLFTAELQRRLTAAESGVLTNAAHPGLVATNIYHHDGPKARRQRGRGCWPRGRRNSGPPRRPAGHRRRPVAGCWLARSPSEDVAQHGGLAHAVHTSHAGNGLPAPAIPRITRDLPISRRTAEAGMCQAPTSPAARPVWL